MPYGNDAPSLSGGGEFDPGQPYESSGGPAGTALRRHADAWFQSLQSHALENSQNAVAMADLNGRLIYANRAFVTMWGYSDAEEIIGRHAAEFMFEPEIDLGSIDTTIREGRFSGERPARRSDGSRFWVHISAAIIPEGDSGPACLMASFIETTERMSILSQLQKERDAAHAYFENASVIMLVLETDGRIKALNRCGREVLDLGDEDVTGADWFGEFLPDAVRSDVLKVFKGVMENPHQPASRYVNQVRTRTGRHRLIAWRNRPLRGPDGSVSQVLGSGVDITDQKAAEDALSASERKYRIITESMCDWVFWREPSGEFVFNSPSCERITGHSSREFLEDRELLYRIIHPDDLEQFRRHMFAAESQLSIEFRVVRPDGSVRWLSHVCQAVHGEQGEFLGRSGSNRDITGHKLAELALMHSRERYKLLVDSVTDYIYNVSISASAPVPTTHSPGCLSVTGYTPEEYLQNPALWYEMVHGEDKGSVLSHIEGITSGRGELSLEHRIVRKDGAVRWVRNTIVPHYDEGGALTSYDGLVSDVTERRLAEDKLRSLATITEQAAEGIAMANLDGVMSYANKAWADMHGYLPEEIIGRHLRIFHNEDQLKREVMPFLDLVKQYGHYSGEIWHIRRDGTPFPAHMVSTLLRDAAGEPMGTVGFAIDITDQKMLSEQLERRALYDPLTGLPNKVLFMDRLRMRLIERRGLSDAPFAVLFADLDYFQKINDSLGHLAGDGLLVEVSRSIEGCVRPTDTVARFGGDEFAVLIDETTDEAEARAIASRVLRLFRRPFKIGENDIYTSASIGIAVSGGGGPSAEELIRDADTAMYHAKSNGRACYAVFDAKMHQSAVESVSLENDLRKALTSKEFELYYQPIIDISENRVKGFEALVRWRHPLRGMVQPMQFIPAAEETGLIMQIGRWVLREAAARITKWRTMYPSGPQLEMNVNLSSRQFTVELPEVVAGVISETGVDPSALKLEITETIIMENIDIASTVIDRLHQLGVELYLDDFGTGYSSLNYLHKFRVKALKIDKSFVRNICEDRDAREIVRAVTSLAWSIDKHVVIEGVEGREQLDVLKSLGCRYIQGYFFSPPLEAKAAERFMADFGKAGGADAV